MYLDPIRNSDEVYDALAAIADISGGEKQKLIAMACKYPKFLNVCKLALDPFITYGLKKVPESDIAKIDGVFNDTTLEILDQLADRSLTGNAAKDAILNHMGNLSIKSQDLLKRIITRDLRSGFSAGSINRAKPNSIFIFEVMLAKPFEEKRITEWPVAVEPKFDGVRCIAIYKDQEVKFYSRTGKEFTQFERAAKALKDSVESFDQFQDMEDGGKYPIVFDGEMMTGEFNKTAGDIHRKNYQSEDSVFWMFEIMTMDQFDSGTPDPYKKRRARLQVFGAHADMDCIEIAPMYQVNSVDEIMAINADIQAKGGEGVIVKPFDGKYEKKRSFKWLKVKACETVDLNVHGFEPGTGKYEGQIGAFLVDFNGVEVSVGSGLTDAIRGMSEEDLKNRLIEVQYHEVTPDKSLRHPRFIRFRDDKPHEDGMGVAA
jgi:DNA ligase-1